MLLTTAEAAERLGITARSVARLLKGGKLAGTLRGRDYLIEEEEVERYKRERRPVGRPKTVSNDSDHDSDRNEPQNPITQS